MCKRYIFITINFYAYFIMNILWYHRRLLFIFITLTFVSYWFSLSIKVLLLYKIHTPECCRLTPAARRYPVIHTDAVADTPGGSLGNVQQILQLQKPATQGWNARVSCTSKTTIGYADLPRSCALITVMLFFFVSWSLAIQLDIVRSFCFFSCVKIAVV